MYLHDDGNMVLARNSDGVTTWSTGAWEPPNRSLVHNDLNWKAVVAGGAPIFFSSPQELAACGYDGTPSRYLSPPLFAGMLGTPRNGTLIQNESGWVAVIAGGTPIYFISPQEVTDSGYVIANSTKVPARWILAQPGSPSDGTLVRDNQTGGIAVIAGGAPFWFSSVDELRQAGYGSVPHTNVPPRWIDHQPATPRDGTLLRSATSPDVWWVVGGRRSVVTPNPGDTVTTISPPALATIPTG